MDRRDRLAGPRGVLEDRMTLAAFALWLHRKGLIGDTFADVIAVMVSPVSFAEEFTAWQAELEAEGAERDRDDLQHVLP